MGLNTSGIKAGRAFVLIDAVDQTGAVLTNVKRRFLQLGTELTNIGRGLFTKGIAAALPLGLGLKVFMDFDDAMRVLAARSKGTAGEMGELRQQALDLGRATAFTAAQVANLQVALAQKNFKRSEIIGMTENILKLARAAPGKGGDLNTDMIMAAELVSGTLRAFRMDASKSNAVADLMATAIGNANYSLEDMIVTLQYAAPAAETFKMSLEETLATVAVLRDLNLDASVVGTAFRNMPTYMTQKKSTDDFNARLSEMTGKTIEFSDAVTHDMHPLPRILGAMGKAMEGLGTTDVGGMFYELFGTRAQIPAEAFARSMSRFDEMMSFFKQSEGMASKMHDTMESGVGGVWREFVSVVEDVGIALGQALEPALMMVGNLFKDWGRNLAQFIRENKGLVIIITSLVPLMIALGAAIFSVGAAIMFVTPALTLMITLSGILKSVMIGIVLVSQAVWSSMVAIALSIWNANVPLMAFLALIADALLSLWFLAAEIWAVVIPSLTAMAVAIGTNLLAAIATLTTMLSVIMAPFLAELAAVVVVLGAIGVLVGIWVYLFSQLAEQIPRIISGLKALGPSIGSRLTGLLAKFKPELDNTFNFIKERALSIFDTLTLVYEAITLGVQSGQMEKAWEGVAQGVKIIWLKLLDGMMDAWEKLPLAIATSLAKLNQGMKEMMAAIQLDVALAMLPQEMQDKLRKDLNIPTFEERMAKFLFPGNEANKKREKDIEAEEANLRFLLEEMTAIAKAKDLANPRDLDRFLDSTLHKTNVDDLIKGGGVSGLAPANMALNYGTAETAKAIAENFMNAEEIVDVQRLALEKLNDIFVRLNTLNHIDESMTIIAAMELAGGA